MFESFREKHKNVYMLTAASALVLAMAGCSDGDSDRFVIDDGSDDGGTEVETVAVTGTAAKGLLINAIATAYRVSNGVVDDSEALGSGLTDSSGQYSVDIPEDFTAPFVIRVAPSDGTTMRCDISEGCGDGIDFGDDFDVSTLDFHLDSLVPEYRDSQINVSVLTTLASDTALDNILNGVETDLSQAAQDANTSVANRFGLTGDITTFEILDLTDPQALVQADESTQRANLFNSAIIQSVMNDDPTATFSTSISQFSSQFVDNGGLADTEEDGALGITLEDILGQAGDLITLIEDIADNGGIDFDLGDLESDLAAEEGLAGLGSTIPDAGDPLVEDEDEALQIVKDTVGDFRTLVNGFDLTDTDAFANQLDLTVSTLDGNAGPAVEALGYAAGAIAKAWEAYQDQPVDFYADPDTEISVFITDVEGVLTFTIDQAVVVTDETGVGTEVLVGLIAVDSASSLEESDPLVTQNEDGTSTEVITYAANIDLSVEGSSSIVDVASVVVNSGSIAVSLTGEEEVTTGDGSEVYEEVVTIEDLSFDLSVEITDEAADDPVSFTGSLALDVSAASGSEAGEESEEVSALGQFLSFSELWHDEQTVEDVELNIAGNFTSGSGQSLAASFSLLANGEGVVFACDGFFNFSALDGTYEHDETCTGETEESYASVYANLAFVLDIVGVSSDAQVTVSFARTGLESGLVEVNVTYGTHSFSVEYSSPESEEDLQAVTVVAANGVRIYLTETADLETEVAGSITFGGTEYATIEDRDGIVTIIYSDGEFESL